MNTSVDHVIAEGGHVVGKTDRPMAGAEQIDRVYEIMGKTLAKNGATSAHVVSEVLYATGRSQLMEAISVRARRYEGRA